MGKPRRFSPEFKARVMLEIVSGEVAPFWWTVILSNWQQAQIVPG